MQCVYTATRSAQHVRPAHGPLLYTVLAATQDPFIFHLYASTAACSTTPETCGDCPPWPHWTTLLESARGDVDADAGEDPASTATAWN